MSMVEAVFVAVAALVVLALARSMREGINTGSEYDPTEYALQHISVPFRSCCKNRAIPNRRAC